MKIFNFDAKISKGFDLNLVLDKNQTVNEKTTLVLFFGGFSTFRVYRFIWKTGTHQVNYGMDCESSIVGWLPSLNTFIFVHQAEKQKAARMRRLPTFGEQKVGGAKMLPTRSQRR